MNIKTLLFAIAITSSMVVSGSRSDVADAVNIGGEIGKETTE